MDYPFKRKTGESVQWEGKSYIIYQQLMALYVPGKKTFPWYGLGNDEKMAVFVYAPYIDFGKLAVGEDPPPDGPCPNGTQPPC